MEIEAKAVTVHDQLAIFSSRNRRHKYVRIHRITHDRATNDHPGSVTIVPADGPAMTLRPNQRIKVANSRGSR